jgi:hypothetical protein
LGLGSDLAAQVVAEHDKADFFGLRWVLLALFSILNQRNPKSLKSAVQT